MLGFDELIELKNPQNTNIKISYDSKVYDLLVVQSISYRIDESKKPIYGFNDRRFHKVLSGKAIASGLITIKKYSKDALISLIKSTDTISLRKNVSEAIKNRADLIYELVSGDIKTAKELANADYAVGTVLRYNKNLQKFGKTILLAETAKRVAQLKALDDTKNAVFEDFLLRIGHEAEIKLIINLNDQEENEYLSPTAIEDIRPKTLVFENLHFISKQTSIDSGSSSIDDTYEFIANVEKER